MDKELMKQQAAQLALQLVADSNLEAHQAIGVGTGNTVNCLVPLLVGIRERIAGFVSSSEATTKLLQQVGLTVLDFNEVHELPVYLDGTDAYNSLGQLVKGGGGALTREKILAYASKRFICMVDASKEPSVLGMKCPVPVEVLPLARSNVAREIVKLGGAPEYRQGFITDNHNIILDVHNWQIERPIELEQKINQIPGVVACGIFAVRPADVIVVGNTHGAKLLKLEKFTATP